MLGVNIEKLLVVAVLVALVVGPQRLPGYAQRIAQIVRGIRSLTEAARAQATTEMGIDPEQWRALDPRRYDPRRIVAEALREPVALPAAVSEAPPAAPAAVGEPSPAARGTSGHPRRRVAAAAGDEASTGHHVAGPAAEAVGSLEE